MENIHDKIKFIGVGAYRSGTTWITTCLNEHPEIFIPPIKEIEFFNRRVVGDQILERNYDNGMGWYYDQFSAAPDNAKIYGEFSNAYLYDKKTPELIHKHFPNVKIILSLRNPVERAYSGYLWSKLNFNRYQDIEFSISKETEHERFVKRSMYYENIKRYYKIFSKNQIHVIIYKDILSKPSEVMSDLYRFLAVDSTFVPPSLTRRINTASTARSTKLANVFKFRAYLEKIGLSAPIGFLRKSEFYNWIQTKYTKYNRIPIEYTELQPARRSAYLKFFENDISQTERLIHKNLLVWKKA